MNPSLRPARAVVVLAPKLPALFLAMLLTFFGYVAAAQSVSVRGNVKDANGVGLPGVNVLIKGQSAGTVTDENGKFSLNVPQDGTLIFSYIGFSPKEVLVNNQSFIEVTLDESSKLLGEVVVVGYGTQLKKDVTGAISSIKAEDLRTQGANTIQKSLQGRVAGVQIESAGGNPGSGVRVLIRGTGSLNNNNPLYIVDGVQTSDLNNLSPADIASIDILKDASAAAIYGSRAANGVVLVTTKSGKKGETKIELDTYVGVQKLGKKLDVLNAQEWATINNQAHDNAGLARLDIAKNPETLGEGTDWQKETYRSGIIQNHTLSISGGTDKATYSVSGGYLDQDGIVKETNYNRLNLRVKSDFTKGIFKFGETIILSREKNRNMAGGWGGQGGNPVGSSLKMIPVFNVYDATKVGGYGGTSGPVVNVANPLAQLNLQIPTVTTSSAIINLFAEVSILDGLKYRFNTGYTASSEYNYNFTYPYQVPPFLNEDADLREDRNQNDFFLQEHTLNFNRTFGKHSLQALVGYTHQVSDYRGLYGSKSGMPAEFSVLDAGSLNPATGSSASKNVLISYLSRLVYSFNDRYVVTATLRRDGSSRFSPSQRYGNFPSVAASWNLSNEPFFKSTLGTFSTVKLRTSYGVLGNQEIPNYMYTPTIVTNTNYVTGQDQHLWPGAIQTSFAANNIKWETSKTFNAGVDLGLFSNKLSITADYFNRISSDILLQVPIPLSTGASANSPYINAGQITNRGVELGINFNGAVKDFNYQLTGTLAAIKNTVDYLGTGTQQIFGGQPTTYGASATVTQAGMPVGAFSLIKTNGIFNSQAEVEAHSKDSKLIQPTAKAGDIRYVDFNNDGKIDQSDRQYVGSSAPKISYGFGANASWKGFDVSLFFQGTYGNKIYSGLRQDMEGMTLEFNWLKSTLNAWTPERQTDFPRAVINDPNLNSQSSDRFLEDGSYLRLRTLQLGYTIPKGILERIKTNNLRIYVSFDNLFTITKYKGFNPDLGRTGSVLDRGVDFPHVAYPLAKTALAGLQFSF